MKLLTAKETELAEAIERLEAEGEVLQIGCKFKTKKKLEVKEYFTPSKVDCDEAVAGTAPLFRQLLTASAEESATEVNNFNSVQNHFHQTTLASGSI